MSWVLVIAACPGWPAFAQEPGPAEAPPARVDVGDVWRKIRGQPPDASADDPSAGSGSPRAESRGDSAAARRRTFIIAPTIGSKPDTGFTVGVAGNLTAHFGDPQTTHISTSVFGISVSSRGQTISSVRFTAFTKDDRWVVAGENRFNWTSQDTFGLGTSTTSADEVNAKYNFFRISETVYRNIGSRTFLGGGIHFNTHRDIRPNEGGEAFWDHSPNVAYSLAHGLPIDSATSNGVSLAARFDSRDSQIEPRHGWFANGSYRLSFADFFGGDSTWQEVDFELRAYRSVSRDERHRVAGWLFGDFVAGGVGPYFDLPATGMDTFGRSGRGYQEGRFRGDKLMYAELEYRTDLTRNGLVGAVVFLNATTTSAPDGGEALFDAVAVGGGFGARLLLSKRSRTNLCLDFGWGRDGSRGVYLAVQEAF